MSKELLEALRSDAIPIGPLTFDMCRDAAAEIERLQAERDGLEGVNKILQVKHERLQTERVILNACSNTAAVLDLHCRIAALESENAGLKNDAELGAILLGEGYLDRMNDIDEVDTAASIVKALIARIDPILDARYALRMAAYRATSSPGTSAQRQQEECQSPGKTVR